MFLLQEIQNYVGAIETETELHQCTKLLILTQIKKDRTIEELENTLRVHLTKETLD